ncbi:MAG: twin-arginine translocase subunit TatB [Xanthomonadales bacterium]|nr:twin-arginine translocase subunit TatB [Xanthomonadales bacterium]
MIEISFGKLLLLALIALIVLGPEKLPGAARTAGALIRRLRLSWDSVRAEVERELQVEEIRRTARESVARMDAAQAELDSTLKQVREVAADIADIDDVAPAAAEQPVAAATASLGHPAGDQSAAAPAPSLEPSASHQPVAASVDQSAAPTAADVPVATADTRTGDLFAGTVAAPPSAVTQAPAPVPAERVDGVA